MKKANEVLTWVACQRLLELCFKSQEGTLEITQPSARKGRVLTSPSSTKPNMSQKG
jgi:hypothetical protein